MVDGKMVRMGFITDDFELAASTICELYKARWDIELFFKQLKQILRRPKRLVRQATETLRDELMSQYVWVVECKRAIKEESW